MIRILSKSFVSGPLCVPPRTSFSRGLFNEKNYVLWASWFSRLEAPPALTKRKKTSNTKSRVLSFLMLPHKVWWCPPSMCALYPLFACTPKLTLLFTHCWLHHTRLNVQIGPRAFHFLPELESKRRMRDFFAQFTYRVTALVPSSQVLKWHRIMTSTNY